MSIKIGLSMPFWVPSAILGVLKCTQYIQISWFLVLLPSLVLAALPLLVFLLIIIVVAFKK